MQIFLPNSQTPLPNPLLEGEGTANVIDMSMRQYKGTPQYVVLLAKKLRTEQTSAENIFWEVVRAKRFFQTKRRRQHPFGRYIADFYCHVLQLVVEIDGDVHLGQKAQEYDQIRTECIHNYNVEVLRFTNDQISHDIIYVIETIINYMNKLPLLQGEGWGEV